MNSVAKCNKSLAAGLFSSFLRVTQPQLHRSDFLFLWHCQTMPCKRKKERMPAVVIGAALFGSFGACFGAILGTVNLLVFSEAYARPSNLAQMTYLPTCCKRTIGVVWCDGRMCCICLLFTILSVASSWLYTHGAKTPWPKTPWVPRTLTRALGEQMATWLGRRLRGWQKRPRRSRGRMRSAVIMGCRQRCWRTPRPCSSKLRQTKHS